MDTFYGPGVSFAKDISIGPGMINARVQSLAETAGFYNNCCDVSSWRTVFMNGKITIGKSISFITYKDPFAFAGIWVPA